MNQIDFTQNGSLTLANGMSWTISAGDLGGTQIAQTLKQAMQLVDPSARKPEQRRLVIKNGRDAGAEPHFLQSAITIHPSSNLNVQTVCQLPTTQNNDEMAIQLMQLSLIFCSQAEARGGILVHGGLAEHNGAGVILAGPSGVGKSTASRRLPLPWKSLCDDTTLIVRDKNGFYHAHPWPTWSTFMFGGDGGSWDVQRSVPLKGIFMLAQSKADRVESIGQGQSACMINETADQAWLGLLNNIEYQHLTAMSLQRFNNISELVKTVPAYILHLSKNGSFWEEIDRVLFNK